MVWLSLFVHVGRTRGMNRVGPENNTRTCCHGEIRTLAAIIHHHRILDSLSRRDVRLPLSLHSFSSHRSPLLDTLVPL